MNAITRLRTKKAIFDARNTLRAYQANQQKEQKTDTEIDEQAAQTAAETTEFFNFT